jgi:hypothetical protein
VFASTASTPPGFSDGSVSNLAMCWQRVSVLLSSPQVLLTIQEKRMVQGEESFGY